MNRKYAIAGLLALAAPALAQGDPPAWTRPTPAFTIIPKIWYVGTEGLGAYLIKTSRGAILIDGTLEANAPAIAQNIQRAGIKLSDVKIILLSHAHFDHAAGMAALQKKTGARVLVGAGDLAAVRTGVPPGETNYGTVRFPAVPSAQPLADGQRVTLGDVALTAIATPGHTPGCTSYTMTSTGRRILFPCSLSVAGNRLIGNRRYPGIVTDFRASFAKMARVEADMVLDMHPERSDVLGRNARGKDFMAPALWPKMVADARVAFEAELAKQQSAARK